MKRFLDHFLAFLLIVVPLSVHEISPTVGGFVKRCCAYGVASGLTLSMVDLLCDDDSLHLYSMPISLYALIRYSYVDAIKDHQSYKLYKSLYKNKIILQDQLAKQRSLINDFQGQVDLVSSCRGLALKINECKKDIDRAKTAWLNDYALSMSLGMTAYFFSCYLGYWLGEVASSSFYEQFCRKSQESLSDGSHELKV